MSDELPPKERGGLLGRWPPGAILVLAAIVLGVFLRLDGINSKSLWFDEVWTASEISEPTLAAVWSGLDNLPVAPLYYTSLWAWVSAWGMNDAAMRSLSVLYGLLTLPVTYITWRHLLGRRAMAWTLALLALNSYQIAYSQDAKMYSMLWLLATASSGCFLNALSGRPGRAWWLAGYGFTTACLPLTSYVGIVPVLIQGIYGIALLVLKRGRALPVLDAAAVALAAMIPTTLQLSSALSAASNRTGISWIPGVTWSQIPWELCRFQGALLVGYRPSEEVPSGFWGWLLAVVYGPCLIAAVALLVAVAWRSWTRPRSAPVNDTERRALVLTPGHDDVTPSGVIAYLALWFLAPVAGNLTFSLTVYSLWGVPRYLFGAAPALFLWLGAALGSLRRQGLAVELAAGLLAVNLAVVTFAHTHYTRTPWREMARAIEDAAATASCLDGSSGAKGDAGASLDMAVCSIGRHGFDEVCIAYALEHDPTVPARVRPQFLKLDDALRRRQPFVVLMLVYMGPTHPNGMRQELEQATPGYACRQLYWQTFYQEPYTSMPTPFMRHSAEVWLCVPRPQTSATDAHAAGGG